MRVQQVQRARVGYSACAGLTWNDLVKLLSRVVRLGRDTTTQAPATLVAFAGNPSWLDHGQVQLDHKEGTFRLPFTLHSMESKAAEGLIATFYDRKSRNHFLMVQFAGLTGRISLTDGSKSAWQSNVHDGQMCMTGKCA